MSITADRIREFRNSIRGRVILPGDEGYEEARRVWNGMIDRRPAAIVRCAGTADVISAIRFARSENLVVAVRGGGHNVAGNATCDDGIVIDLSSLRSVHVDPVRRTARANPGATWGDFDHETSAFGLATTGGLVSTTGVAGFTLGGGLGWLMRKHGLACDNLLSVDVVTADGRLVKASREENSDLFSGVRGGGGNFGIVTSFEFQVHPLPMAYGGMVLYHLDNARGMLRAYREVAPTLPDELNTLLAVITAPPEPFIPAELHGLRMFALVVCYAGDGDGDSLTRPLRALGTPAFEFVGPMPYPALQSMFDGGAPTGIQNYWKSAYLSDLSDAAIDTILQQAASLPQPMSAVHIHQMGGAVRRVGADETAFTHRDAEYCVNLVGSWFDPADNEANVAWVRTFFDAIQPFTYGVYVNFLGDEGEDRVRAAYGDRYAHLAAIKAKYDPTNFFRLNQNIHPALDV